MLIPLWASIPFAALLLAIAVAPLISRRWWDRYYPAVSLPIGLAAAAGYAYLFGGHERIWHTAHEYISFISLLASLFVVTGGILIRVEGRPHPLINAALLFVGAVISNVIGTTGAAMLFIRPYLHINRERLKGYLVVFFIFIVANIGGSLTPIGDPPLFLGYLKGVPFAWVFSNLWPAWLVTTLMLLAIFVAIDHQNHRAVPPVAVAAAKTKIVLKGWYNFFFLAVILAAVFKPTPIREGLMIAAALSSYLLTPRSLHREHRFSFGPIIEVAVLFLGIFAAMMPALDWLEANASDLGLSTAGGYYWATGVLSSFLDNAPTYLSLLSAATGLLGLDVPGLVERAPAFVKAISLGAVFFGAMTYIGNGPNFMVRAIADRAGAHCPSFFGYMLRYSIPILIPVFFIVWLVFLQ